MNRSTVTCGLALCRLEAIASLDGKKQLRASIVFAHLQAGRTRVLSGKRLVWGRLVYISALRLESGKLLIVITPESCPTAISNYGKR